MDENLTDLAHAAAGGDEDAWSRLVERFMPLVRSVIRSYSLYGQDAEDVGQTLWLRLVEHLKDIRDPRALPGWIATTTRNECARLLKSTRRMVPVGAAVEPHPVPQNVREVDEDLLAAERHQMLLQALAQLPEHQRNLLILLVADPPLTYAEIGRRLNIPTGSIGPTRARALQKLRECHAMAAIRETSTEGIP
ncbi:MAG: RNA polymerase sigma factor [Pseudonocardiaceae bacterium]